MIPTPWMSKLLYLTAVVNVVAGLANAALPDLHATLMLADGVVIEGVLLRYHVMLWLFVAVMGLGFGIAATDPERFTALITAGACGKLVAAGVWVEMVLAGHGGPMMWGGILFDTPLALAMVVYVATGRRRA